MANDFEKRDIPAVQVGYWHDEVTIDCEENISGDVKKICEDSFPWAGSYFNLRIPLEGEGHVGDRWCDIH